MPGKNLLCGLIATAPLFFTPLWAKDIIFSAPPNETVATGKATYGPIAEYLSQVTGERVVYKHPDNWLTYIDKMQDDAYDLVFDGPHFVSWRIAKLGHTPLVKLPGNLDFVIIARRDNGMITEIKDLAGRRVCGHAPPNLATLTLQSQFSNPSRQPLILATRGWPNIYKGVLDKKCDGASIPTNIYDKKLSSGNTRGLTRVLFRSKPLPHQSFSASPRISPEIQQKITRALLAPEAKEKTAKLRGRFAGGKAFLPATTEEYRGLAYLLRDIWGFEQ